MRKFCMHKLFIFALFSCLVWTVRPAANCKNPLLGPKNPNGPEGLSTPTPVGALQYCPKLQGKDICCTAATISNVGNDIQSTISTIQDFTAKRDVFLVSIGNAVGNVYPLLDTLEQKVNRLKDTRPDIFPAFTSKFGVIYDTLFDWKDSASNFRPTFLNMQEERKKCYVVTLKYFAATKCLACDSDYASNGLFGTYDSPKINFSPRVYTRIGQDCYNYFKFSSELTQAQYFAAAGPLITFISKKVDRLQETGIPTDLLGGTMPQVNISSVAESYQTPVKFPDISKCASRASCNWACDNFIVEGQLDLFRLQVGGETVTGSYDFKAQPARLLAQQVEAIYNPDEDEAGVTIEIEQDPAHVGGIILQVQSFMIFAMLCIFGLVM